MYAYIRRDLLKQGLSIPIGKKYVFTLMAFPFIYTNNDTKFKVLYKGIWQSAYSIDFDFK